MSEQDEKDYDPWARLPVEPKSLVEVQPGVWRRKMSRKTVFYSILGAIVLSTMVFGGILIYFLGKVLLSV